MAGLPRYPVHIRLPKVHFRHCGHASSHLVRLSLQFAQPLLRCPGFTIAFGWKKYDIFVVEMRLMNLVVFMVAHSPCIRQQECVRILRLTCRSFDTGASELAKLVFSQGYCPRKATNCAN
jgi:hypothetical protein